MSVRRTQQDEYSTSSKSRSLVDAYRRISEGNWFVGLVALYLVLISAGKIVEIVELGNVPVRLSQAAMVAAILSRAPFLLGTLRSPIIALLGVFVLYNALMGYLYWSSQDPALARIAYGRVLILIVYFGFAAAIASYSWSMRKLLVLATAVAVPAAIIALAGLVDAADLVKLPIFNDGMSQNATFFTRELYIPQYFGVFQERTALGVYATLMVTFFLATAICTMDRPWLSALFLTSAFAIFQLLLISHNRAGGVAILIGVVTAVVLLPRRKVAGMAVLVLFVTISFAVLATAFPRASGVYMYLFTGNPTFVTEILIADKPSDEMEEEVSSAVDTYRKHDLESSDRLRFTYLTEVLSQINERPMGYGPGKLVVAEEITEPHSIISYILYGMGYPGIIWLLGIAGAAVARLVQAQTRFMSEGFASVAIPASVLVSWLAFGVMHDVIYFGTFWLMLGLFVAPRDEVKTA